MVLVPVSNGELVDKLTILDIKSSKIKDPSKLININKELLNLKPLVEQILKAGTNDRLYDDLKGVNLKLWDIEDKIRNKEREKCFDEEFIELARSVYIMNDLRSKIKKEVDISTSSQLSEEKSYEKY
jgi:hypothetical protein